MVHAHYALLAELIISAAKKDRVIKTHTQPWCDARVNITFLSPSCIIVLSKIIVPHIRSVFGRVRLKAKELTILKVLNSETVPNSLLGLILVKHETVS